MKALVEQLLVLYIFILVGVLLGRWKKDAAGKSSLLSFLLVNLFFPCKMFSNFSKNFTLNYLQNNYITLFLSLGILAVLILAGSLAGRLLTKEPYERKVYHYSTTVSNYAFFGYVLVEYAMGEAAMNDMMVFCLPFSVYCYTFGVALLLDKKVSLKSLCNATTISIALGMVFGLTGLQLPGVLQSVASSAAACVGPVSMVLVGLVLSGFTLRQLLPSAQTWIFCAVRLLVVPGVILAICLLLRQFMELPSSVYPSAVLMACMPCGLNPVVYPKLIGKDCALGAKMIPLTALLSCATIPFWLWVMGI